MRTKEVLQMKELYIKPEVELKRFDILDVISTSDSNRESPGDGSSDTSTQNGRWSKLIT